MSQVKQLFTFDYLGRKECTEVESGDIGAVVGVDSTDIGDVYTDPENPVELEPIEIDPPTLSVVFEASTSPLVGQDGDVVGGRQLKERLMQERENNVTMQFLCAMGPALVAALVIDNIGAAVMSLLGQTAYALWIRQFDVASWRGEKDPLPPFVVDSRDQPVAPQPQQAQQPGPRQGGDGA